MSQWVEVDKQYIEVLNLNPQGRNYNDGCQDYEIVGDIRRKYDKYGYIPEKQSLSETIISKLLQRTNLKEMGIEVLDYNLGFSEIRGVHYSECPLFAEGNTLYVSFKRFLRVINKEQLFKIDNEEDFKIKVKEGVEQLQSLYKISNLGIYLTTIFMIDMLTLNPDRNTDNFGLVVNLDYNMVKLAPIFDNGMALKSTIKEIDDDTTEEIKESYPYFEQGVYPTNFSLREQFALMNEIFPTEFKPYTKKDIEEVFINLERGRYGEYVYDREVIEYTKEQLLAYLKIYEDTFNVKDVDKDKSNGFDLTWT